MCLLCPDGPRTVLSNIAYVRHRTTRHQCSELTLKYIILTNKKSAEDGCDFHQQCCCAVLCSAGSKFSKSNENGEKIPSLSMIEL